MQIASRVSMWSGARTPQLSLSKSGTSKQGFFVDSLGSLPVNQTFTCWYRFLYPAVNLSSSRVVLKYGNASNGAAFGSVQQSLSEISSCAALCEARYWHLYNSFSGQQLADTGWHHLAFLIKSGSSPLNNSVYIDGTARTKVSGSGSQAYITPSGKFSICGRDAETMDCTVQVFHPRIYNELLGSSAISEDMTIAGIPTRQSLAHYWDGTTDGGKVYDFVGNWNLTFSTGCEIVDDAPSI